MDGCTLVISDAFMLRFDWSTLSYISKCRIFNVQLL